MVFKKKSKSLSNVDSPESLFRDLRTKTVEGLLSQQADLLRKYMEEVDNSSDIALELPTGSGKTLVGLLIAEWRRRTKKERCVFLCPTKQLVHQVAEHAFEKYGINVLNFAGSKHDYNPSDKSRFLNCENIGIATYSSLFNNKSFFDDIGTIIFDDAHSAENYVSQCWSLQVFKQNEALFRSITGLIGEYISEQDRIRFEKDEDTPLDSQWVNKLPTPYLLAIKKHIIKIFDQHCTEGEHFFRWQMLRDHIHACHLYYTNTSILLRPIIPPVINFSPFITAKQRIYMSATLGEGGDLERIFGQKKITRIPAPEGWDKHGVGR